MLRNLYNTSRDVTPPLPPPPLALLRPPHQLLNARGSLWVAQSVSQSVRPTTAAERLPAHMRGARVHTRRKTVCGIYY